VTSRQSVTETPYSRQLMLIITIGPLPGSVRCPIGPRPYVMDPGIQGVTTHWIWGFTAFPLVRRTRSVMLVVPGMT
jgi:hypothetical protein